MKTLNLHGYRHHEVPGIIASNRALGRAEPNLLDLAPTILAVLGLPVSGNMTGSALVGLIPRDVLEEHPLTFEEPPWGPAESTTAPRESERMERLVSERMGRLAGAP